MIIITYWQRWVSIHEVQNIILFSRLTHIERLPRFGCLSLHTADAPAVRTAAKTVLS